jgi:cysteine desulfurase family protein
MPDGARIYMDNSATSFPKPPAVAEAMARFAAECGASAGRGAYVEARACEAMLAECRRRVARLINAEGPERIVFTLNCSHGLNIAIRGLLNRAGAVHAISTMMDHNSVLRPYHALAEQTGLDPQFLPCDGRTGLLDPEALRRAIRPSTRLVSVVHASNVTGTLEPVQACCDIARAADVPILIDAAQSAGHVAIDVQQWGADFVAFPGHKGLLGPLGTGVLYIRPGAEQRLATMHEGGTGTVSELATHPTTMPDKYEVGSHNAVGLAGLSEGVGWLLEHGVASLRAHAEQNMRAFFDAVAAAEAVTVFGPGPDELDVRTDVFSVAVAGLTPHELSARLEREFGVLTRPGVHCAPFAHQTIGTHPGGSCRLSFGPFTTVEQARLAGDALVRIGQEALSGRA